MEWGAFLIGLVVGVNVGVVGLFVLILAANNKKRNELREINNKDLSMMGL